MRWYYSSSFRCISFDSYIKPQLHCCDIIYCWVVYLLIPTSNHNVASVKRNKSEVVYLLIPTSNHNFLMKHTPGNPVVYLLIPTSNHNNLWFVVWWCLLYIFWFLHQTTTSYPHEPPAASCISFDSYIKPQLIRLISEYNYVVYLLIPTSNHNFDEVNSLKPLVVYLLIPTSNHNCDCVCFRVTFVVYLLIPTSNHNGFCPGY